MRVVLPIIRKVSPFLNASIKKTSDVACDIVNKYGEDIFNLLHSKQNYDTFTLSKSTKVEKPNKQNYL